MRRPAEVALGLPTDGVPALTGTLSGEARETSGATTGVRPDRRAALREADAAMYRPKGSGRGSVRSGT